MERYPKKFRDIKIKYKGQWHDGYYEGDKDWRIFTSISGMHDTFVADGDIEDWKESEVE